MSNPYFSVGEEVILQSKDFPHLSGDHIIERVFLVGDPVFKVGNHTYVNRDTPAYHLEGENDIGRDGYREPWVQSVLRKKHKPSTDSFTEMMSNINELVTQ